MVWYKFLRLIKKRTCDRFTVYNDGIIDVRTPNKDHYQCFQFWHPLYYMEPNTHLVNPVQQPWDAHQNILKIIEYI